MQLRNVESSLPRRPKKKSDQWQTLLVSFMPSLGSAQLGVPDGK